MAEGILQFFSCFVLALLLTNIDTECDLFAENVDPLFTVTLWQHVQEVVAIVIGLFEYWDRVLQENTKSLRRPL